MKNLKKLFFLSILILALSHTDLTRLRGDDVVDSEILTASNVDSLITSFSPVLKFKAGENFFPVEVGYHVNNSILKRRYWDEVYMIDEAPSLKSISQRLEDNYFLDNRLNYEELLLDYEKRAESLGYTLYARVLIQDNYIVVQYWIFYPFNDASFNRHEGDWECIMLMLNRDENPISVVYSQHGSAQKASWSGVLKKGGTHPVAYVARGSHANFFRPYQGTIGFENNAVGARGVTLDASDFNVEKISIGESNNHRWINFGGMWGDWGNLTDVSVGYTGPYGPGKGENYQKWHNPIEWAAAAKPVNQYWLSLNWLMSKFTEIFLVFFGVKMVQKILKFKKNSEKTILKRFKTLGKKEGIGIILGVIGLFTSLSGAVLPWFMIRADIQTSILSSNGNIKLLQMDGIRGMRMNMFNEWGLIPVFNIGISFWMLILAGFVFGILDLLFTDNSADMGRKNLRSGIFFWVFISPVIFALWKITSDLESFSKIIGFSIVPEISEIINAISKNPFFGASIFQIENFGSVYLEWGLQIGTYLIIISAILRIISGLILLKTIQKVR